MESLPQEIIIEIFKYLSFNDLRSVSLVCVNFNDIINSIPELLEKFRITIGHRYESESSNVFEENLIGSRKYQKMKLKISQKSLLNQPEIYYEFIKDLEINFSQFDLKSFKNLVEKFPNLKRLSLKGGMRAISTIQSDDDNEIPLPKLKLDFLNIQSNSSMFDYLLDSTTKELSLGLLFLRPHANFLTFLKRQKDLQHLNLFGDGKEYDILNDESLINVDFKLKKLVMFNRQFHQFDTGNFQKFLQNQRELHQVQLGTFLSGSYTNIVNNLSQISNVKEMHFGDSIYFDFQPMTFVDYVVFDTCMDGKIHELFPNATKMTIKELENVKFVENYAIVKVEDYIEVKLPEKVRNLTLEEVTFKDEVPFDYNEIKIDCLTIIKCNNIDWLIEYLENDKIKLKSLEIKDTKVMKVQRQYLENLHRKGSIMKVKINAAMNADE